MCSFVLGEDEREIYHDIGEYNKKKVKLVITNKRVIGIMNSEVIFEVYYSEFANFKYQRKLVENQEKSNSARFKIIDINKKNYDFKFVGPESVDSLKKSVDIIKGYRKICKNERNKPEAEESDNEKEEKKEKEMAPEERLCNELYQLEGIKNMYEELVEKTEIIGNDEFWSNFKVVKSEYVVQDIYQETGYSGKMLSKVSAMSSEGSNNVIFYMTPESVRQIFAKKPIVAKMHKEFLQEHKEEGDSDFWFQYFMKKEFSKQRKNDKENIFKNVELESLKFNPNARLRRYNKLEPSAIAGRMYECLPGQGTFNKESLPTFYVKKIYSTNMHSELALIENKVVPSIIKENDEISEIKLVEPNYFEDLKPKTNIEIKNLFMVEKKNDNHDQHFDEPSEEFDESANSFASIMNEYKYSFSKIPLPYEAVFDKESHYVLGDITPEQNDAYNYNKEGQENINIRNELNKLRTHKVELQILLFNFWNNYFSVKKENKDKALKLKDKIVEFQNMLNNEKTMSKASKQVELLYSEMLDSIEKALDVYKKKTYLI